MDNHLFSQRYGYASTRSLIQFESIDDALRVDLWNVIYPLFFAPFTAERVADVGPAMRPLFLAIQRDFFRSPVDEMPRWAQDLGNSLKEIVLQAPWYRVFDLLDFLATKAVLQSTQNAFIEACNSVLERELSAYRFVNRRIAPVSTNIEVEGIERALRDSQPIAPVHTHLARALDLLADRQAPDYRNSIKESISAVEALCVLIASQPKAKLSTALAIVEKRVGIHGSLKAAFGQLYGYTSDAEGIRHALLQESDLDLVDAQFMLVSCSGFVTYLLAKASRASLTLS